MAKKIILKTSSSIDSIREDLRNAKIEHVYVHYPAHENRASKDYIVVKNLLLEETRKICGDNVKRITNARHYENTTLRFIESYYEPKFNCTCRHCDKSFESRVKTALIRVNKCVVL